MIETLARWLILIIAVAAAGAAIGTLAAYLLYRRAQNRHGNP